MPNSVRQGVVAVVQRDDGRYLLIRRAPGVVCPGAWCFVGGAIEAGETQAQALVREFREEMGAVIVPLQRVWCCSRPGPNALMLHFWTVQEPPVQFTPNPSEVSEWSWLTATEIRFLGNVLRSNLRFLEFRERFRDLSPTLTTPDDWQSVWEVDESAEF